MSWDLYLIYKIAGILVFVFAGAFYTSKSQDLPLVKCLLVTTCTAIAGFTVSRVWFIMQYALGSDPYDPASLAEAWNDAGSVLYGWILGGTATLIFLTRFFKMSSVRFLDRVVPWMLIAQMLNRFGCFAGQCCWGKKANIPWAVWNEIAQARVHPVQLYEAAFDAVLFFLVIKRQKRTGEACLLYFAGYAAGRFFLEFFRGDNHPALFFMTVPQVASVLILLVVLKLKNRIIRSSYGSQI